MENLNQETVNFENVPISGLNTMTSDKTIDSIRTLSSASLNYVGSTPLKTTTLDMLLNGIHSAPIDSQIKNELRSITDLTDTHFEYNPQLKAFTPKTIVFGVESSTPSGSGAVLRIEQVNEFGSILSVKIINGGMNYIKPKITVVRDEKSLIPLTEKLDKTRNDVLMMEGGTVEYIKSIHVDQTLNTISDKNADHIQKLLNAKNADEIDTLKREYANNILSSSSIITISDIESAGLLVAEFEATIIDGVISEINIINGGSGYTYYDSIKIEDTVYLKLLKVPTATMTKMSNISVQQYNTEMNIKYGDVTVDNKNIHRIESTIDNNRTEKQNVTANFSSVEPPEGLSRIIDLLNSTI